MRLTFERGGGGGAGEAPVAGIVVVVVALPWGSLDGDAPRWLRFAGAAAAAFRVSPESRNTAVVLVSAALYKLPNWLPVTAPASAASRRIGVQGALPVWNRTQGFPGEPWLASLVPYSLACKMAKRAFAADSVSRPSCDMPA